MATKQTTTRTQRAYVDFVPSHDLLEEGGAVTLVINLTGFKKEQVQVQMNENSRKLFISGERPLSNNRWSRCRKEFQIPGNCNADNIRAKFESGSLHIVFQKSITEATSSAQAKPKPSVEQDGKSKKEEGARSTKSERSDSRSDAEKVEETGNDQPKEPKDTEKVASKDQPEDGEKGTQRTDAGSGAAVCRLSKLKLKMGGLEYELYITRKLMLTLVVVTVVSVGVGLYLNYKMTSA